MARETRREKKINEQFFIRSPFRHVAFNYLYQWAHNIGYAIENLPTVVTGPSFISEYPPRLFICDPQHLGDPHVQDGILAIFNPTIIIYYPQSKASELDSMLDTFLSFEIPKKTSHHLKDELIARGIPEDTIDTALELAQRIETTKFEGPVQGTFSHAVLPLKIFDQQKKVWKTLYAKLSTNKELLAKELVIIRKMRDHPLLRPVAVTLFERSPLIESDLYCTLLTYDSKEQIHSRSINDYLTLRTSAIQELAQKWNKNCPDLAENKGIVDLFNVALLNLFLRSDIHDSIYQVNKLDNYPPVEKIIERLCKNSNPCAKRFKPLLHIYKKLESLHLVDESPQLIVNYDSQRENRFDSPRYKGHLMRIIGDVSFVQPGTEAALGSMGFTNITRSLEAYTTLRNSIAHQLDLTTQSLFTNEKSYQIEVLKNTFGTSLRRASFKFERGADYGSDLIRAEQLASLLTRYC